MGIINYMHYLGGTAKSQGKNPFLLGYINYEEDSLSDSRRLYYIREVSHINPNKYITNFSGSFGNLFDTTAGRYYSYGKSVEVVVSP